MSLAMQPCRWTARACHDLNVTEIDRAVVRCQGAFARTVWPLMWLRVIAVTILVVGVVRGSALQIGCGAAGAAGFLFVDAVQVLIYRSHVLLDAENLYLPRVFRPPVTIPIADVSWIGLLYTPVRPQSPAGWRPWMTTTDGRATCLISAFYSRPTKPKPRGAGDAEGFAATVRSSLSGKFAAELWTRVHEAQGAGGVLVEGDAPPPWDAMCRLFWSAAPGTVVKPFSKAV